MTYLHVQIGEEAGYFLALFLTLYNYSEISIYAYTAMHEFCVGNCTSMSENICQNWLLQTFIYMNEKAGQGS